MIAARIVGLGFAPAWQTCVYAWRTPDGEAGADTTQWLTSLTSSPHAPVPGFLDTIELLRRGHDMCFVRRFPLLDALTPQNRAMAMAHEAFHCLQREWTSTNGGARNARGPRRAWPAGPATRCSLPPTHRTTASRASCSGAGCTCGTATGSSSASIRRGASSASWSRRPAAAAVWTRVVPIWQAGDNNEAAWAAAVGGHEGDVLDTWGSGLFREPSFPAAWQQRLPFAMPDTRGADYNKPTLTLGREGTAREETLPYRADMWVVRSPASPLVKVDHRGARARHRRAHGLAAPLGAVVLLRWPLRVPARHDRAHHDPAARRHRRDALRGRGLGARRARALVLEAHDMSEFCTGLEATRRRRPRRRRPRRLAQRAAHHHVRQPVLRPAVGRRVRAGALGATAPSRCRRASRSWTTIGLATTNTAIAMRADGHRLAIYDAVGRPCASTAACRPWRATTCWRWAPCSCDAPGRCTTCSGPTARRCAWTRTTPRAARDHRAGRHARGARRASAPTTATRPTTSSPRAAPPGLHAARGGRRHLARYGSGVGRLRVAARPVRRLLARPRRPTSLFDYAPGQSPATFVDRAVPRREFTMADFTAAQRRRRRASLRRDRRRPGPPQLRARRGADRRRRLRHHRPARRAGPLRLAPADGLRVARRPALGAGRQRRQHLLRGPERHLRRRDPGARW